MALIDELREVKLECEAEMADILHSSDEEVIQKELKAFEEDLRTTYADRKADALKEKELEIRAIDNLIAREEKRAEAAKAEEVSATAGSVPGDSYYPGV